MDCKIEIGMFFIIDISEVLGLKFVNYDTYSAPYFEVYTKSSGVLKSGIIKSEEDAQRIIDYYRDKKIYKPL